MRYASAGSQLLSDAPGPARSGAEIELVALLLLWAVGELSMRVYCQSNRIYSCGSSHKASAQVQRRTFGQVPLRGRRDRAKTDCRAAQQRPCKIVGASRAILGRWLPLSPNLLRGRCASVAGTPSLSGQTHSIALICPRTLGAWGQRVEEMVGSRAQSQSRPALAGSERTGMSERPQPLLAANQHVVTVSVGGALGNFRASE